MATQPYEVLVEEDEDKINSESVKLYSEASASQVKKTPLQSEVNDSDIIICSTPAPPCFVEERQEKVGEETFTDNLNNDATVSFSRYLLRIIEIAKFL